jgi:HK97 gp10 family phage protein
MANQANGVKVKNLREVTRALKAIGEPVSEIRAAGKEAGQIVATEAKGLTPVRTGKLRDSIRVSALGSGAVRVQAGNNRTVPYANPIHWGWFYDKENFIKKNIKPNPFFSKAIRVKRDEVLKTYFDNMEKLINKWTTKGNASD